MITTTNPMTRPPRKRTGGRRATTRARGRTFALAVLFVASITLLGALALAGGFLPIRNAFAAPATITGKVDIVITNKQQAYYEGAVAQCEATIHLPDGTTQVAHGHCISGESYAVPLDGTYDYVGTLQADGTYDIVVHSEVSPGANSDAFLPGAMAGTQQMGGIRLHYKPKTTITFQKSSKDPSLTEGNGAYSLEGATYDIYDKATDEKVATITTDTQGSASCTLERDKDYYAVETKAPQGYALNNHRIEFHTAGDTGDVALTDHPARARLRVQKIDSCTGGSAQYGASLEGAEFSIGSTTLAGWRKTVTTDKKGEASIGDIPLGTIVVTETKAPVGYKLDSTPHTYTIDGTNMDDEGVIDLKPLQASNDISAFDLEIVKYLDTGADGSGLQPAGKGIRFEIVANSTGKIVGALTTNEAGKASTADAQTVNPEAVSPSATYDAGKPWMGSGRRNEHIAGALPYDAKGYTIHEDPSTTPEGYRPCPDWTVEADQLVDGATLHYIVDNDSVNSRIQVVKTDAADGKAIPLAGFTFQLLDSDKNVISQEVWYPQHAELSEFTTDDSGTVTFPEALKPGTYYLREVAAAAPYLVAREDVRFTISDKEELEPVTVVRVEDEQAEGIATIHKTCSDEESPSAAGLEGAEFDVIACGDIVSPTGTVQAAKDSVVDHVVTDREGTAKTKNLPLGNGSATYAFVETKAPDGHVLDDTPRTFTLSYADQATDVVYAELNVANAPTDLQVVKTDSESGEAVEGAVFALWNTADQISVAPEHVGSVAVRTQGDQTISMRYEAPYAIVTAQAPDDMSVSLTHNGSEPIAIDADGTQVPAGTYTVQCKQNGTTVETNAPTANINANTAVHITITQNLLGTHARIDQAEPAEDIVDLDYSREDDAHIASGLKAGTYQVMADGDDMGTITLGNGATYLALKDNELTELPVLLKSDANPISVSTNESGMFNVKHLAAGIYHMKETSAPSGYVASDEIVSFEVGGDGLIDGNKVHHIAIANDFTKIEISKADAETETPVEGAQLSLVNDAEETIDTWTSTADAHMVTHVTPGSYSIVEVASPQGHDVASPLQIEVEARTDVQRFTLYDEPISIEGSIDKRQQIADPTASGTMADDSDGNRAEVRVSADGSYDYTLDFRNESTTWVDEFTVTDHLDGVEEGLSILDGVTCAITSGDYDGKLNVWFQTNQTPEDYADPSQANATLDDGHANPWLSHPETSNLLGEDGRALSYVGWRLWAQDVSTQEATHLSVDDLGLEPDEKVTAIRFEYGRVDAGFTSRKDAWDREDIKDPHDDVAGVPDGGEGTASAILHMHVTDAYTAETELDNTAQVDLFRNGGGKNLEDHDEDFVTQAPVNVAERMPQTSAPSITRVLLIGCCLAAGTACLIHLARTPRRPRRCTHR